MEYKIAAVGAGRMGRGIALHFALTGYPVLIVDLKERTEEERDRYVSDGLAEIRADIEFLVEVGLLPAGQEDTVMGKIKYADRDVTTEQLSSCEVIFEGVPEVLDAKRAALAWISDRVVPGTLIASTTSTISVNELAAMVAVPENFMNAHWLNPAHLMPLVEIARGDATRSDAIARLKSLLESVGKVPVVCGSNAGYIVPRLQCLIMNEAARMVEEGVASAEEIDLAVNVGFGIRYATLGVLEFIDWGGGDIVYYASNYMKEAIHPRFEAPQIIHDNMVNGRNGIRDGVGFFDYRDRDVAAYRKDRMQAFVGLLKYQGLLPKYKA